MEPIIVSYIEKPKLRNPILVEGLPGIGNIGKIAADYLAEYLKATKFAHLYSKYFPPHVFIDENGITRMVNNEFYYYRGKNSEPDLIIVCGDYQGLTPEGQYEIADCILKIIKNLGCKRVYTLAGYATRKVSGPYYVFGAATTKKLADELKKYDVKFERENANESLIGASGLIIGLGYALYNLECACLMAETSGYITDPRGAQELLKILSKILNIPIDTGKLQDKAKELELIASHLKGPFGEMLTGESSQKPSRSELDYIG